jgi:hypothetical protein
MKLVADENIDREIVVLLEGAGHAVLSFQSHRRTRRRNAGQDYGDFARGYPHPRNCAMGERARSHRTGRERLKA